MVMTNTMRVYTKTNELGYVLTTPTGFNAENEHLPLIVYLHGAGERGDNLEAVKIHGIPKLFSADPDYHGLRVVTLSPQCPDGKVWDNLTEQLMYLIETIVEDLAIDRDRITLTGNSMGGFGTYEMGCSYPGTLRHLHLSAAAEWHGAATHLRIRRCAFSTAARMIRCCPRVRRKW